MLGLNSRLKRDAQGFAEYYRQRAERLAGQVEGFVIIDLRVEPQGAGGRLLVEVRDSGAGFDVAQVLAGRPVAHGFSGRGVNLVQRLGRRARWLEGGCVAQVDFEW